MTSHDRYIHMFQNPQCSAFETNTFWIKGTVHSLCVAGFWGSEALYDLLQTCLKLIVCTLNLSSCVKGWSPGLLTGDEGKRID